LLKLNKNGLKVHQLLLTSAALWGPCTSGSALNIWNKFSKIFSPFTRQKMFADGNVKESLGGVEGDTAVSTLRWHQFDGVTKRDGNVGEKCSES
jgi:hypothetical protein